MKFNDAGTQFSTKQEEAYQRMFGDKLIVMEEGKQCICEDPPKQPVPKPVPVPEPKSLWDRIRKPVLIGAAGLLALGTAAALLCPFDGPFGEAALGSATAATWGAAFAIP
jgi:hypothetical protein